MNPIIFDRDTIYSLKNVSNMSSTYEIDAEFLLEIKKKLSDKYVQKKIYPNNNRKKKEDVSWRFIKKTPNLLKPTDEIDKIKKLIIGILNKLTHSTMNTLAEDIKQYLVEDFSIKFLIDNIFSNAIIQPNNCNTYVTFCKKLSDYILEKHSITIETIILEKCNSYLKELKSIENVSNSDYDKYCLETKKKICNIGNIQLFGELYINNLVNEETIREIIYLLFSYTEEGNISNDNQDYIINMVDCLFKLISTVYKKNESFILDNQEFILERSKNKKYPAKARFMYMDILDIPKKKYKRI